MISASERRVGSVQLLAFEAAGRFIALDIMRVKEIVPAREPTVLPSAPPFVVGAIELRGAYIPLIDLRARLGGVSSPPQKGARHIVVTLPNHLIAALWVDRVSETVRMRREELRPAPSGQAITALVRYRDRVLGVLDLDRLLDASELAALETLVR